MNWHRSAFLCSLAAFLVCLLTLISTSGRSKESHGNTNSAEKQIVDAGERGATARSIVATISTDNARSAVIERQRFRRRLTAVSCSVLSPAEILRPTRAELKGLLVNDRMRFIYCKVEHAACTTWKRQLVFSTGAVVVNNSANTDFRSRFTWKSMQPLSSYNLGSIQNRLENYYLFMFIREPLDRLVAAYRDKMMANDERFYVRMGGTIKRRFVKPGDKSFFQAFVRFVIHEGHMRGAPESMDIHWRPQYSICRPCSATYDFIGHHETLYDDADHVIRRLTSNTTARFPSCDPDTKPVRSSRVADSIFSTVSDADIKSLLQLYERDYEMFGYSAPHFESNKTDVVGPRKT